MKKCPVCNHMFTSAQVSGAIVWGQQHVAFDQNDVITAVSPIISNAVMKPGKEFSKIDRVVMTCPNPECKIMLTVDKFIHVYECPITGYTDGLIECEVGGVMTKIHHTVSSDFLLSVTGWLAPFAIVESPEAIRLKSELEHAGFYSNPYR